MSSDVVIAAHAVSKAFPMYRKPHHRLLQMVSRGEAKRRWYQEFQALRSVDLTVHRGETVGIVGRNGSGKSTLLQLVCGTLSPSSGSIEVRGRIAALLELGAGFNPEFSGRENAVMYGTVLGLSREEIESRLPRIIEFADIGSFVDEPVKTYSSGMYVRLAFAVAINVDPDILVVDEALAVGDEAFQRKCYARIHALRERGTTVLFVSHSSSAVVELCDRAILLDQGEKLAEGQPKQLVSWYQKLLYAPPDRVDAVRTEIRQGGVSAPSGQRELASCPPTPAGIDAGLDEDAGYWEEGLRPQSTVAYERNGATIEDPRLETPDGRRVNVLVCGARYVYRFGVRFDTAASGVRCGMMIRTVTGVELAGAATAHAGNGLPFVEAGQRLEAAFEFRCLLAPGTYFLNAGVLGAVAQDEVFLDRRLDVAMFRVQPARTRRATGWVDLDFVPRLSVAV